MTPARSLFELSRPGRRAWTLPGLDVPAVEPAEAFGSAARDDNDLPELSEIDIARHFIGLSVLNHHVDRGFYPLGSCTMKYNPKVNERAARMPGLADLHPLAPEETVQGALQLMYELGEYLKIIAGMDAVTLQPAAGAQGELCGIMMVRRHFETRGETHRNLVLVPDSAHGTNPASVTLSGFKAVQIKSNDRGEVDPDELDRQCTDCVACLMMTNPNTLGIFESRAREICAIMHRKGALVYLDGANLNSYLGIHRPGDAGFDLMHINLHKTFSTPHGGGGPGSGPVVAKAHLASYLPRPLVVKDGDRYRLDDGPTRTGVINHAPHDGPTRTGVINHAPHRLLAGYGQFGVLVKAWCYIRMLGAAGLRQVSEDAVLAANYVRAGLEGVYDLPYPARSLHEVVFSGSNLKKHGVRTLDVAKRLLDFGLHAPTIYFPLIVPEALMIEPTETESKEALDEFVAAMKQIAREAAESPDLLRQAPVSTPVRRLDEARASRELDVNYQPR